MLRNELIGTLLKREYKYKSESVNLSEVFGVNVFDLQKMKTYLTKSSFEKVEDAIKFGNKISIHVANDVANAMKTWAISVGATHFTHWFQPLTGSTAEKHDAFVEALGDGTAVNTFEGISLVQQEPDASSFPSGGLRNTFEARGYTAWDPSSPAFVLDNTLCIPTIFVSYTGEALDYKAPLLNALTAVDKAATEVAQIFDKTVEKVFATLGWEQEFFLIDELLYHSRPDLQLTGRTLFGHVSAKHQQLKDHYFGSINERTMNFFKEFEYEAIKLGIPVKTRHNEVAPMQFECAPMFEECNLSVDHNLLTMDLMKRVAARHHFKVLFHEKPFDGINGSGKHNNWSLHTDSGINLLKPGKNPKENLQFLAFFVCAIKAVHDYPDLLRASYLNAANDHRLGSKEAPPSILSVFIGSELTAMLDEIETKIKGGKMTPEEKTEIKLNIGKIPQILVDNTDRNRTSPFAFTGNKFEIRAVGSSLNCSAVMTVLNTMMAKVLGEFKVEVETRIEKGLKKDEAIFEVLRKYIIESKNIRFEGDSYSEEWIKESKKRGLSATKNTIEGIACLKDKKVIQLFEEMKVLSASELEARYNIKLEQYKKMIQIEARTLGDLAINHIIPAAINYQHKLLQNIQSLQDVFGKENLRERCSAQIQIVEEISKRVNTLHSSVNDMVEERKKANLMTDSFKMANAYALNVFPYFILIRNEVDKLEQIVDDKLWPLPKYRELMFLF
ncbi:MAG: hypothetical protein RLZZ414_1800 [Bacteroidota bacterium]|jgi:glutamine synthetase